MSKSFFEAGAGRAARVHELFSKIASRYDLINDLQSFGLHRHWKRQLIDLARPRAHESALDVCCGTGDLALALARRGLEVVGVDFSEPMLEIARARAARLDSCLPPGATPATVSNGRSPKTGQNTPQMESTQTPESTSRLKFVLGDAQQLPFPDSSFDLVVVGYGLRNLTDWQKGLEEMHRVAKPGGRVLVLDFGKPDNPFWRAMYFGYLRFFVPVLGLLFCGSARAYSYILESLRHYPAQSILGSSMRQLGMARVQMINFLGGVMSIHYGQKAGRANGTE